MKEELRKFISRWSFLPLDQFSDEDSLSLKRKDFRFVSKMAMIVDCIYPIKLEMNEDEIDALDTVTEFYDFLKKNGIHKINQFSS